MTALLWSPSFITGNTTRCRMALLSDEAATCQSVPASNQPTARFMSWDVPEGPLMVCSCQGSTASAMQPSSSPGRAADLDWLAT